MFSSSLRPFVHQVISARRGEFESGFDKGGQTREHAMLAKTAGVKHLIVVINKMDDPTVNWSKERCVQFSLCMYSVCLSIHLSFLYLLLFLIFRTQ